MNRARHVQKLNLTAGSLSMAKGSVDMAAQRLRELFDAGEEYGSWALALQEIGATLATIQAEIGDEVRRQNRRTHS